MPINIELYENFDGSLDGRYKQGNKPSASSPVQLAATNYVDRVADPELIFPRPDSETPAWAKHRRHHPNVPYRIPIGISFGSWPFYFEAISMPTGATVGSWLTASGDKLIVGDDYGVVEWSNPTVGNHSFHIKVHFQDGYPPLDVQWTLEVTTAGTIFIDPVNGNDSTGDGTIGNPFQTVNAWWLDDLTDTTYSQYQVCYRGGTHNVSASNVITGVSFGNWRLVDNDKPLVHYGYSGESVVFDMSNTTIVIGQASGQGTGPDGSDWFFGGITTTGGNDQANPKLFAVNSPSFGDRTYTAGQGGQRMTWFENSFTNASFTQTAADNGGVLWSPNSGADTKKHYWLCSRNTLSNISHTGASNINFNGFYISNAQNHLNEHMTVVNCDFGREAFHNKTTAVNICQRNVDYSASPQSLTSMISGSYDSNYGGAVEYSYCKFTLPVGSTSQLISLNGTFTTYDSNNANYKPYYLVRNTFNYDVSPTGQMGMIRGNGSWPFFMYGNFCQTDDMWYDIDNQANENSADADDFVQVSAGSSALDVSLNLQGANRTNYLGQYGAEVSNG